MRVYRETEVTSKDDFEFWSGAEQTVDQLTDEEFAEVIACLEESYPDGMSESELNDFFWFEDNTISGWIGRDIWEDTDDSDDEEDEDF